MDVARGGQFDDPVVPCCECDEDDEDECDHCIDDECYPEDAWFHYADGTCEYECMAIEYVYWGIVTNMNILNTPEHCEKLEDEWEICEKSHLQQKDPQLYNLLNDPAYKIPTVAPDGQYCCCDGPTCNSYTLWVSEAGCLDMTPFMGKYFKIGTTEFSGYAHEHGGYEIQFDQTTGNWGIYQGGLDGELMVTLGSGECAPGIFNGIRVSAQNLPDKFGYCKTCDDEIWAERCEAPCESESGWSECKCLTTGYGPQCKKCVTGQHFYGDTGTCVDEATEGTCSPETVQSCQMPCVHDPDNHGDCKCVTVGWGDQCVHCPPGLVFVNEKSDQCVEPTVNTCNQDCNSVCFEVQDNPKENLADWTGFTKYINGQYH